LKISALIPACVAVLAFSVAISQTGPLVAQDAWIRATPGSDLAAAYLTLRNVSANPVIVTGVQSPAAGHAMIHETTVQGGQSRMRPHEQLVIPAGKTVKLEPGGLHVMLHDLTQPLSVGQSVPLVICLSGGGTLKVTAQVRPLTAE
jgi:copper(I)-binding protein